MKNVFGYTFQKLQKGGSLFKDNSSNITKLKSLISKIEKGQLPVSNPNGVKSKLEEIVSFQQGGVRNRTMSSGYKGVSKPKDIKPEGSAKRTLMTEKIADTKSSAYGANSGNMDYQDARRAKQQELVKKYGMLDDDTLINKYKAGEVDKETGQLLSDAYNRDLALKNNQTTYKRKFNSAIGLNPELDYLAAGKMDFNTPSPVKINTTSNPESKKFSSNTTLTLIPGKREDGKPNYNNQGLTAVLTSTGTDGKTVTKNVSVAHPEVQMFIKNTPGHIKDLVNIPYNLNPMKHKDLINAGSHAAGASSEFKKSNQ